MSAGTCPNTPCTRRSLAGELRSPWPPWHRASPRGQRSGAHLNPAVTLTFFRLGKIAGWDAVFYVIAQAAGGVSGIVVITALTDGWLAHPAVRYVTTLPGASGVGVAFAAEVLI